jgi:membrane protein DedA with SNARE-associated domain
VTDARGQQEETPPVVPGGSPPSPSTEDLRVVRACLGVLGVLVTSSALGVALSPYLLTHHPLLLLALSPIGRHLVLVAPTVDPLAFTAVVVVRRLLFYAACFLLGRALGPAGIPWLEARAARFARFVRWVEALFARASHAVVLLLPGPTVSGLAGISGMGAWRFGALATSGLVLRALLVVAFGAWMREPIEALLDWIGEYWIPATALTVAAVALHQWRRMMALRRARSLDPAARKVGDPVARS